MAGATHFLLPELLLSEPPHAQMRRSKPSVYFGKLSLRVRVPSERALQTEYFPTMVPENGEK
jgi:hypothetical protein